ncbi:MAG: hypothetical protein CFE23_02190 [Flavobacterium sp. BFFFF1]|nr:MAG: hypothetical protein CFE23_02190 [Flavobacterium sp. BFFFF1]
MVHGQVSVTIKSKETGEPISYANVWKSNKIYASSDSLGTFSIGENELNIPFKISALGYKTKDSILINEAKTIYLEEDFIELKEVLLSKKVNAKKIKVGKLKNGDVGVVSEMNKETAQIGRFFSNDSGETLFLDKFRFKAICATRNCIVNILIYAVGKNGEPAEIINRNNIPCKVKKGHHINEVDLSDLNIQFPPEGIFIMVNYLFLEQNKLFGNKNENWYYYEPSIDAASVESYTDTWYNYNNEWKKNDKYSVCFQLSLTN